MADDPASPAPSDANAQSHERPSHGWLHWLLPSYAEIAFISTFLAVVLGGADRVLHGDGDLASHLRLGDLILSSGSIPTTYPFTWGPEGLPFLAHAWLGEVTLALTHSTFGLAGIVVLTATLVAFSISLFVRFLLAREVRPSVVLVGALAVFASTSIHWLGRSHLFTWLGAIVLLSMLESRRRVPWWSYTLLFAAWANLHGGFVFGVLVLGAYTVGKVADAMGDMSSPSPGTALWGSITPLLAALAGTLLNPRGPLRYVEIGSLLGDSSIINLVNEFASPDFHTLEGRLLLVLLLTTMVALWTRPRLPIAWIAVVLIGTAQALFAIRNAPLFALTVFPLALVQLTRAFPRPSQLQGPGPGSPETPLMRSSGAVPLALVLSALIVASQDGRLGGAAVLPDRFSSDRFPVEAVAAGRSAGLDGRLFSVVGWGGYVVFAWPEQQPFVDGLLYSGELLGTQSRVEHGGPSWDQELDRLGVDVVLAPSIGPLAYAMNRHSGWARWHCDATAALFVRNQEPAERGADTACPLSGG